MKILVLNSGSSSQKASLYESRHLPPGEWLLSDRYPRRRSIDTSMGFTPLDGLMMGTRSDAVDPGILTFLMRETQLDECCA